VFYSFSESSYIYNPANAILFLDKKDSVFAFIETCFQCWAYRVSKKKINMGDECTDKYELVKNFFLRNEIRVGTMGRLKLTALTQQRELGYGFMKTGKMVPALFYALRNNIS